MYSRSAIYYDLIYSFKNYRSESEKLDEFIQQFKKTRGKTLLDLACGTGSHITYLKNWYEIEGLDINPEMLTQARRKHPEIVFHKGVHVHLPAP